jgi:hypothetical protein
LLACVLGCAEAAPELTGSTLLEDTYDRAGPYTVSTIVRAQQEVAAVELHHRAASGATFSITKLARISGDARDGAYSGTFAGPAAAASIEYFYLARTSSGTATDPPDALSGSAYFSFRVLSPGVPCEGAAQCGAGEGCVGGRCATQLGGCARSEECGAGFLCKMERCTLELRACATEGDCLTSEICDSELLLCVPR